MNISSVIPEEIKSKIASTFQTMEVSPAKNSDKLAKEWLKSHKEKFVGFVNNAWISGSDSDEVWSVTNPFTSVRYADVCVASSESLVSAAEVASESLKEWETLSGEKRADIIFKIAETVENHAELFAQVESLLSGKQFHRIQKKEIPNLIQNLKYCANWTNVCDKSDGKSGVLCVIAEEFNEPTLSVSWRISSLLAAGNTVLLLVDLKSCLSAFLFAELCHLSGLPAGVLNILPINQESITMLPKVSRFIFSGSRSKIGRCIQMACELNVPFDISLSKRPVIIVYESSDLLSAIDGVLQTLYYADTRSERSGCKVFVQSSIKDKFHSLLEDKLSRTSIGSNLYKTDMTCIVSEKQSEHLKSLLEEAKKEDFKVIEGPNIENKAMQFKPSVICNVPLTSKLSNEVGGGPVIVTTPFRTPKESIAMFNHDKSGPDVSIWTEKLTLALELAHKLKAGTIWVNTQNVFDASAVYGRAGLGSTSSASGKEAFFGASDGHFDSDLNLTKSPRLVDTTKEFLLKDDPSIKRNFDLFIGGSNKKPSDNLYRIMCDVKKSNYAWIAKASVTDVRSAVSSAVGAQPKWEALNKYKRSDILRKAAVALGGKMEEFVDLLQDVTALSKDECVTDITKSVSKLRVWANHAVTSELACTAEILDTELYGKVFQDHYPVGVIAIVGCDHFSLLPFLSLVIPAITYGSAVVVVLHEAAAVPVIKMCQILQSSGVLGGVINAFFGDVDELFDEFATNANIDALWGCCECHKNMYHSLDMHPKRIFDCRHAWKCDYSLNAKIISEATQQRCTFMPMGTIFAN